jgi:3-hydroxy-D-aspartate aldolase
VTRETILGPNAELGRLSTPALVLDLDALERNIARMADFSRESGVALRPHAKTHKSVRIARMQVEAGALGVCCATLGEAEVMVDGGVGGVLITSPVVSVAKVARLVELNARAERLMVVADHADNVAELARASAAAGRPLRLLVDIDPGIHRTGVRDTEAAAALARQIEASHSLELCGVQVYAGHLQHVEDFARRSALAQEQHRTLADLVERLMAEGRRPAIVTGAGTGTHAIDAAGPFTELQTGSYVFMDVEYNAVDLRGDGVRAFEPALFVAATVVSANADGFVTVDAGLKAFATDGPKPEPARGAPAGSQYAFMGDEHGALILPPGVRLELGSVVECLTPHCDPTVNLYDRYHVVRGETLEDVWPVDARGAA